MNINTKQTEIVQDVIEGFIDTRLGSLLSAIQTAELELFLDNEHTPQEVERFLHVLIPHFDAEFEKFVLKYRENNRQLISNSSNS
jgi:hypothetical protein